jgi:phage-related protein
MIWQVKFFQTARGNYPVKDFIDDLGLATQTKVAKHIRLLINYGPYLRPPYSKKLWRELYELRITGKNAIRIIYAIVNNIYYLLHAFKKKTDKIPQNELKIALDRMREII